MRLIDADELNAKMYQEAFEKDSDMQKWDSGCWIRYKMFEKCINTAPTIDPVKHEHWTRKRMLNHALGTWKTVCMCSGCRHTQWTESAFCGGCGAKMDGDKDE